MPDLGAINAAFEMALGAIPGIGPIAWPNRLSDPARPFVLFEHVPTNWENATVDATETRADGYIIAAVCIAAGEFTTEANETAMTIIQAFPVSRRLGGVCVVKSGPIKGYFDGVGWRQPVRIEYRSEAGGAAFVPEVNPGDDW